MGKTLRDIDKLVLVGNLFREFGCENETFGGGIPPLSNLQRGGYPIVARVDLDSVENLGVELQKISLLSAMRIEGAHPVRIRPSATADMQFQKGSNRERIVSSDSAGGYIVDLKGTKPRRRDSDMNSGGVHVIFNPTQCSLLRRYPSGNGVMVNVSARDNLC